MSSDSTDRRGARMELEPDAFHDEEDGYVLDCPECGSTVSLDRIIEEGRCDGSLAADDTEVEHEDEQLQDASCTAVLSLELVWES